MAKNFRNAVASFVGTVIGAGIFGLPFAFAETGFTISAILFFFLFCAVLLLHLMYGEIVERTEGTHRLIGYANIYLGKKAKDIASISTVVGSLGGLIAYLLLAHEFLVTIFGTPPIYFFWGMVFWVIASIGVLRGMKTIARAEFILSLFLILALLVIIAMSGSSFNVSHLQGTHWSKLFLPYGIILFTLAGFPAIPEIQSNLKVGGKRLRNIILVGSFIVGVVCFLFAIAVLGVSGHHTSPEAIQGLSPYLGKSVLYLGAIAGLLAIITSYLVMAVNLKDSFIYDWNTRPFVGNLIAVGAPLLLIALGVNNFIEILGITGAFLGAIDGIMITALFVKARQVGTRTSSYHIRIPYWVLFSTVGILGLGIFYVIMELITKHTSGL